jgi:hypothetical protein
VSHYGLVLLNLAISRHQTNCMLLLDITCSATLATLLTPISKVTYSAMRCFLTSQWFLFYLFIVLNEGGMMF